MRLAFRRHFVTACGGRTIKLPLPSVSYRQKTCNTTIDAVVMACVRLGRMDAMALVWQVLRRFRRSI